MKFEAKKIDFPYPFLPSYMINISYNIFPTEYENNESIIFHGTNFLSFESITEMGFKAGLSPSVSFSQNSSTALGYACGKRIDDNLGVVIAADISNYKIVDPWPARRQEYEEAWIEKEGSLYYLRNLDYQPKILAYCLIPKEYEHI